MPYSSKVIPDPAMRSFTVRETMISFALAMATTREAMCISVN